MSYKSKIAIYLQRRSELIQLFIHAGNYHGNVIRWYTTFMGIIMEVNMCKNHMNHNARIPILTPLMTNEFTYHYHLVVQFKF